MKKRERPELDHFKYGPLTLLEFVAASGLEHQTARNLLKLCCGSRGLVHFGPQMHGRYRLPYAEEALAKPYIPPCRLRTDADAAQARLSRSTVALAIKSRPVLDACWSGA